MTHPLVEEPVPADPEAGDRSERGQYQDTVLAVLLALVALTAALTAWRTSVAGSNSGDLSRQGMIETVDAQTDLNVHQQQAYMEAEYAAAAAIEKAAAQAMHTSDQQMLRAAAAHVLTDTVPWLEQIAGPFPRGGLVTDAGTFDVPARVAQLQAAAATPNDVDPQTSIDLAQTYSNEKTWLTVAAVVLAVALFWLGLAEISTGRWRTTNMLIGVAVWAVGLGGLVAVELAAHSARAGAL